ncbi:MAG: VCBS repeat-containing protein [Polyangiales bacterium]
MTTSRRIALVASVVAVSAVNTAKAQTARVPPAVTAACRALEAAANQRAAAAWREFGRRPPPSPGSSLDGAAPCHAGPWGAWALSLDAVEIGSTPAGSPAPTGRWSLRFITPAGVTRSAANAAALPFGPLGRERYTVDLRLSDLDGDGVPEVFVRRASARGTTLPTRALEVFTSRGDTVSPYGPAQPFASANDVEDRDGDGLDDLVWTAIYTSPDAWCQSRVGPLEALSVFARGQRDGTWRADDPVALGLLRLACPQIEGPLYRAAEFAGDRGEGSLALARRVACARLSGASPDDIGRRLATESRGADTDRCVTPEALTEFARTMPTPLTLPRTTVRPVSSERAAVTAAPAMDPELTADAALDPRIAARCATLAAQSRGLARSPIARARGADFDDAVPADIARSFGRCAAVTGGAWITTLDAVRAPSARRDDGGGFVGAWSLRFVGVDGRVARGLAGSRYRSTQFYLDAPSMIRAFDYDGDGRAELVLREVHHEHEATPGDTVRIYTSRDGAVRRYAPADALRAIDGAADADRDGRPDLIDTDTLTLEDECMGAASGAMIATVSLLAHSLPDGTFSRDDATARRWVEGQCPSAPTRLIRDVPNGSELERDRESTARNVACARFWGASATDVIARLHDELVARGARPDDRCLPATRLGRFALFTPPFELRPR